MKIYVDGCSYAAADGLDSNFRLANLINADFDASYGGKCNESIFHDTYKNLQNYDLFVISLTYANRFVLFDVDDRVKVLPQNISCPIRLQDTLFESLYSNYHKLIYTLYDQTYFSEVSDAFADSLITMFEKYNKKFVMFTWEKRNNIYKDLIKKTNFNKCLYLPDGHLNEKGMTIWAKEVLSKINVK